MKVVAFGGNCDRALCAAAAAIKKVTEAMFEAAKQVELVSKEAELIHQFQVDTIEELRRLVETLKEYPSTEQLMASLASFYYTRDPIPKTPYKPSYKTVIFDKRLKFPKCRSNCR